MLGSFLLLLIVLLIIDKVFKLNKIVVNGSKIKSNFIKNDKIRYFLIGIFLVILILSRGIFYVDSDKIGLKINKIGSPLNPGQIIADSTQKGKQADIVMPGWNYIISYPWVTSIKMQSDLVVPTKHIAILIAKDGAMNPNIVANKWSSDVEPLKMITDFKYFKEHNGTRGVQQYKLTTGTYKINRFVWDVKIIPMIEIKTGNVLVIESIYGKAPKFIKTTDDEILAVPLVESGEYRGIVNKSHPAGVYGLNPFTEKGRSVPVNLLTFVYKGGYTSKKMDINIDSESDKLITVKRNLKIPAGGDGDAFTAKTSDGYSVHIGVRVLGQVEPIQAPRFVGTIKEIKYLDDKIIEPYTKTIIQNIVVKYKALELKNKRALIAKEISKELRKRTEKTGFRTKTVEVVDIDIPPIVLIPEKIKSAAFNLKSALIEKQNAISEAIKVQNLQQTANKQGIIVDAKMKKDAADLEAQRIVAIAKANKEKMNLETDANVYQIKQSADADKYKVDQQAKAAKNLAKEVGKEVVGTIMIAETIGRDADKYHMPSNLTIVNSNGSKNGNSMNYLGAKLVADSIKSYGK
jgi:regulator of protease activity HflC (stomatin/prohibitin superfamily)